MTDPRNINWNSCCAFTLIEVVAVLVLVGLLATAVSFTFADRHAAVRIEDLADQLVYLDGVTRSYAKRFGRPVAMRIDLNRGQIERLGTSDGGQAKSLYAIPKSFSIERIVTGTGSIERGEIIVSYSAQGLTDSYGIVISSDQSRSNRCVLVLGFSGQAIVAQNPEQLEEMLAPSLAEGPLAKHPFKRVGVE